MAQKTDVPKNFEIWIGGPYGLRLQKHPRLDQAREYLEEYPMVIRKGRIIDQSSLSRDADPTINVSTIPAMRRSSVGPTVELRVEVDLPPSERKKHFVRLRFYTPEIKLEEHAFLIPGKRQILNFPFPYFDQTVEMIAELQIRDGAGAKVSFKLQSEKQLTFFTAFQTHLDLGWTERPAKVIASLKEMTANVAIDVCRQFADNPPGQRFVWTCECSEALRFAWEGSGPEERKEILKCLEEELIQCCCLPYSFHSSIMSKDLMARAVDRSFKLRNEIGAEDILDLSVAQQNDVPGHSWGLPDVLAEKGVRRAIIGHNHMVRGCTLPPLFRWRGPEGGEVLTLATTCCDYGGSAPIPQSPQDLYGLSVNNPDGIDIPGTGLFASIGYGENCGPEGAANEMETIKAWNEQFEWPKIQVGGPKDFFEHIEKEIDSEELPVIDQEISDWWVDGPASTPRAMAQYRKAMVQLPELAEKADNSEGEQLIDEVEENLVLHAEHTFGLNAQLVKVKAAAQNWDISSGLEDYLGSWEDKEEYAAKALAGIEKLKNMVREEKTTAESGLNNWQIDHDEKGITQLVSPQGTIWFLRDESSPGFGFVIQRLMDQDLGEWFHHDPPCAPNAGDNWMEVNSVQAKENGLRIEGILSSPAGEIPKISVEINNDNQSEDLIIDLKLENKIATAQAEVLAMALPLSVKNPEYQVDVAGNLQQVDTDQLPDANRDAHAALNGWIVNDQGKSLAVSSAEVFLWHFGELRYCNFIRQELPRNGQVYAHLFNNLWETNFRCWIEGDLYYRLRVRDISGKDPKTEIDEMSSYW